MQMWSKKKKPSEMWELLLMALVQLYGTRSLLEVGLPFNRDLTLD